MSESKSSARADTDYYIDNHSELNMDRSVLNLHGTTMETSQSFVADVFSGEGICNQSPNDEITEFCSTSI